MTVVEIIATTIKAAMSRWAEHVAKNHPGIDEEHKVKDLYQKYQTGIKTLIEAGSEWTKASDKDGSASAAESKFNLALSQAGSAAGDLLRLIEGYGVDTGPMAVAIRSLSRNTSLSHRSAVK